MLRIFKYELRRRRNKIFIFGGTMAGLSLGTLILLLFKQNAIGAVLMRTGGTEGLWYSLTVFALVFIPMVMFFTCSNGHVDELLYKDTNYLMLTIPIRSEAILGGRLLAGFVEFSIYAVIASFFGLIFLAWGSSFASSMMSNEVGFSFALSTIMRGLFIDNILPVLYFFFSSLAGFLVVGTGFMFVKALTRSFIRRKTLAQILAVVAFVFIFYWLIRLGSYLSVQLDLVQSLDLRLFSFNGEAEGVFKEVKPMEIHLVTTIMLFLVAAGFFVLTSRLFDKKVEL